MQKISIIWLCLVFASVVWAQEVKDEKPEQMLEVKITSKGEITQGEKGIISLKINNISNKAVILYTLSWTTLEQSASKSWVNDLYLWDRGQEGDLIYDEKQGIIKIKGHVSAGEPYWPTTLVRPGIKPTIVRDVPNYKVVSTVILPNEEFEIEIKVRPVKHCETQVKCKLNYFIMTGKEFGKMVFFPQEEKGLYKSFALQEIKHPKLPALVRATSLKEVKKEDFSGKVEVKPREFSLEDAYKKAGFQTDFYTYSAAENSWVLVKDGKTYFVNKDGIRKLNEDYVELINAIEISPLPGLVIGWMPKDARHPDLINFIKARRKSGWGMSQLPLLDRRDLSELILKVEQLGLKIAMHPQGIKDVLYITKPKK